MLFLHCSPWPCLPWSILTMFCQGPLLEELPQVCFANNFVLLCRLSRSIFPQLCFFWALPDPVHVLGGWMDGRPSLYGNSISLCHPSASSIPPRSAFADDDVVVDVFDRQCAFVCDAGGGRDGCENIKFEKGDPLCLDLSIELSIDRSIDLASLRRKKEEEDKSRSDAHLDSLSLPSFEQLPPRH